MDAPLNVLILEDRPADAELMVEELRKAGFAAKWRRVDTEHAYLAALEPSLDVILSDHSLPQYDSVRALAALNQRGLDVPFVIVSGTIGEELAVSLMKQGAADYVWKDRIARLGQAVIQALQKKHLREDKRHAEQALRDERAWFRALTDNIQDCIVVLNASGKVVYSSPSCVRIMGYTPAALLGSKGFEKVHPEELPGVLQKFQALLADPDSLAKGTVRSRHADGSWRWLDIVAANRLTEAPINGIILTYQDVTERKQADEALRKSEDNLRRAQAVAQIGSWHLDIRRNQLTWTDENYRIFGVSPGTAMTYEKFLAIVHPEDRAFVNQAWTSALRGEPYDIEHRIVVDGKTRLVREKAEVEFDVNGVATKGIGITQDITQRKEAEAQLLLQGAALEAAANSIVITDQQGAVAWVNNAFAQLTGYAVEEVVGKNPRVLKSGQQDSSYYQNLWSTITGGKVWHGELVNRRKDGSLYTEEMTITPVCARGGGITHFIAIKQDVTERKQAMEALRQSEAKLSAIGNAALDAIIMIDSDGNVMFWNPAAERLLDYSSAEILGKNLHHLLTPQRYKPDFDRGLAAFKQSGQGPLVGKVVEVCAVHRDGHEFPVEVSLAAVRLGEQWCAVGVVRDITERKQAQLALEERARLAALTAEVSTSLTQEASLQGILQRCTKALVQHLDAAFARIWTLNSAGDTLELQTSAGLYTHLDGPHARVPVGQHKIGLIAQERKPLLTNQVIGDPRVHNQEWAQREGMVAFAGHPLVVGEQVRGVLAVFAKQPLSEATLAALQSVANAVALGIERSQADEALRRLNTELELRVRERTAQLETANEELESFAYSVSHDLRAPLRGIDGFSQALLEDYNDKLDADGQDYLRRVRAAALRMNRLIEDILQLSRLNRSAMNREEVDLSVLAARVIADLQATDPARHVEICLKPGLMVNGDARLLEVVLTNLIGNAWKFTSKTESARIELGVSETDGKCAYFVRDNGAGFDMANADRLFGAFQRLHTEAEFPGTGIGLATVQRVIRRHGGEVWAEGAVGKGATFYFTLPAMLPLEPDSCK